MNLPAELLPTWLVWTEWPLFAVFAAWNAVGAPWKLLYRNLMVPVYLGGVVMLIGLWWMKAESQTGLGLHFLGITSAPPTLSVFSAPVSPARRRTVLHFGPYS